MQTSCHVELFGQLRVVQTHQTISRFALQKAGALLAYLALRPGPHPREQIVDLFWPDMDLPAGRDNLSTTLVSLRRQLEPAGVAKGAILISSHSHVGLNPQAVTTDASKFERLLDQASKTNDPAERSALLDQAVVLYQGDLLPGIYLDWAIREMERMQVRFQEALKQLAADREQLGDLNAALQAVQRSAALDAYSEEIHEQLIRLYVANGHHSMAREAHRKFAEMYGEEYGVAPSPALRGAVTKILSQAPAALGINGSEDKNGAEAAPIAIGPGFGGRTQLLQDIPASSSIFTSAPAALSRFVGRSDEMQQLGSLLPSISDLAPLETRLVTITGPGGMGKTRLATEFACRYSDQSNRPHAFVELADLSAPDQVAGVIAKALGMQIESDVDSVDQLSRHLNKISQSGSFVLLILDNLEHLLQDEDARQGSTPLILPSLVQKLLDGAAGLRILCTSRRRLGLRGERLVSLSPLPVPESPSSRQTAAGDSDISAIALLQENPSVRLYIDRAQAVRPDFALTPKNAMSVAALCRQLEGSPLAIELAAAWVRILPPRMMWERLTRGLDMPPGAYVDLPERHRSLSAALDWSYQFLTPAQSRLFARLSVFQGGWTLEAAEQVCDEPGALILLARLQDASLLITQDDGRQTPRYRFLETVRVYAKQRLSESGDLEAVQLRHAAYFVDFVELAEPELRGPDQLEWLSRLDAEQENIRVALDLLADRPDDRSAELELRLAGASGWYWRMRGFWGETGRRLDAAIQRYQDLGAQNRSLLAKVLNIAGIMAQAQRNFDAARSYYERSLEIRQELGECERVAGSLHNLGFVALQQRQYARARDFYEQSLAIEREFGNTLGIADELHHLAIVSHEESDLPAALKLYDESLALRRPLGDLRGVSHTLHCMANIAALQSDYNRASSLMRQVLAIRREMGDPATLADALCDYASVLMPQGDIEAAVAMYREGLELSAPIVHKNGIILSITGLATAALTTGETDRAGRLYGAAQAVGEQVGFRPFDDSDMPPHLRARYAMLRERIQIEARSPDWQLWGAPAWEPVVEYALSGE